MDENLNGGTEGETLTATGHEPEADLTEDGSTGSSMLTRDDVPGAEKHAPELEADGNEGQGKQADSEPGSVPEKPEDYQFQFAPGVEVDRELEGSFRRLAHEMGLSQKQAQKLADMYAGRMAEQEKTALEARQQMLLETQNNWEKEITARPGFKRELENARKTLREFGSPELTRLMDDSLLGSHPVFFDFVAKVGRALAEPESRRAGDNPAMEKPLADRLWPDM